MAYVPVPGANTSGSTILAHLQGYALQKTALGALRPKFVFYDLCEHDVLGLREGKTRRFYRYTNLASNTTTVPEGVVGTSVSMSPSKTLDATVAVYEDFMTISAIMRDTAPDALIDKMAEEMGFRAGLTIDNVSRTVIDAESGALGSTLGTYMTVRDFRAQGQGILPGADVEPMDSGWFEAICHPYNAFDIVNDPSAGGLQDLFKYTSPDKSGTTKIEDRGLVAMVGNVRIKQSTNVKKTTGSPNQWRAYVVGKQALGTVSLSGYVPNQIQDPNKQTFKVTKKILNDTELANPTGSVGGFVSYRFATVTKVLEGASPMGGTYRYSMFDAPSSIVA